MNTETIIEKIRALRAKASDSAATEAEAMAAAQMAAKLLERYDIEEAAVAEKVERSCGEATARQRAALHPVTELTAAAIGRMTQTKPLRWLAKGSPGRIVFYGAPVDVEMAVYLSDMLTSAGERTMISALADQPKRARSSRSQIASFRDGFYGGFSERLCDRLSQLARDRETAASGSRDVAISKRAVIESYLREASVAFQPGDVRNLRGSQSGAMAGQAAGSTINLGRPLRSEVASGPIGISA